MHLIQERKAFLLVGAMTLVFTAACASLAPIQNVSGQPIATNKPVSMDQVGNAILAAGASSTRTQMTQVRPGVIQATRTGTKGRMAIMEIKYDTKQYSITYKDSQNMYYDGSRILEPYNGWVEDLDKAILKRLQAL